MYINLSYRKITANNYLKFGKKKKIKKIKEKCEISNGTSVRAKFVCRSPWNVIRIIYLLARQNFHYIPTRVRSREKIYLFINRKISVEYTKSICQ